MTRETRPSRFPADTVPSIAGRSKHLESLAAVSIELRTTGLTRSQLRLWGKLIDKVADRGGTILEPFLVGVVQVLVGEGGLAGGAPVYSEESLQPGVAGSNESLIILGDELEVVCVLLWPNSRHLLDPFELDVLFEDEESPLNWRRKSDDGGEDAEGLRAVEARAGLRSPRVVGRGGADMSGTCILGSRVSSASGRGGRRWDLDEGESLALLIRVCVLVWRLAVPTKTLAVTVLSSWVTGGISVSPSGDNRDGIPSVRRLASLGDEVSVVGANRVGTGRSVFPIDG
jgi:hypothetical protein